MGTTPCPCVSSPDSLWRRYYRPGVPRGGGRRSGNSAVDAGGSAAGHETNGYCGSQLHQHGKLSRTANWVAGSGARQGTDQTCEPCASASDQRVTGARARSYETDALRTSLAVDDSASGGHVHVHMLLVQSLAGLVERERGILLPHPNYQHCSWSSR